MFLGSNLSEVCTKEMIQADGNGTCEIIQSKAHTEQRRRQTEITLNPDSKNVVAGSKRNTRDKYCRCKVSRVKRPGKTATTSKETGTHQEIYHQSPAWETTGSANLNLIKNRKCSHPMAGKHLL